ncbi:hypothetical protein [Pseudobacillus badius]|uniref:hypothetical protein n=1 Tax=Bacillus badius TaxID=1455 RepID=UPI0007B3AC64|nr:hypothetical protein [Bacillus badius]KZR58959.1 hypothetical protein A3781_00175 [Bacillus badius]
MNYDDAIADVVGPLGAVSDFISGKKQLHNVRFMTDYFFENLQKASVPSSVRSLHDQLIDNFIELTNIALRPGEPINSPSRKADVQRIQVLNKVVLEHRKKILDTVRG